MNCVDVRLLMSNFEEVKEQVIAYFDKLISCENPNTNYVDTGDHPSRVRIEDIINEEDDLAALVNTVQRHTKKCTLKTCLRWNKKLQDYKCRYGFPKELRAKSDIVLNERKFFEFEGKRNDDRLNKFIEFFLTTWRANGDGTPIVSEGGFLYYIAKYAAKPEVRSVQLIDIFKKFMISDHKCKDLRTAVTKTFMTCLVERDYSGQEVHHILSSKKLYGCSRSFVKVNLKDTEWLYHIQLEDIEDQGNFSENGNEIFQRYVSRPSSLRNVSLHDFVKKYNLYTCRPRKRDAIVMVYPKLKYVDSGEVNIDLVRQLVMLNVPWETFSNLPDTDDQWHLEYSKNNLSIDMLPYYKKKTCYDFSVEDDEDEEFDQGSQFNQDDWMKLLDGVGTEESEESDLGSRPIDVAYDWKSRVCSSEERSLWINFIEDQKKSNAIPNDGLPCNVTLSKDQVDLMLILRKQIMKLNGKYAGEDVPQVILVQGSAGSGKSTVIMSIVDRVSSTCGRRAVLVVGPTGISALHVNGKTIHNALRLQFGKITNMTNLKAETLHKFLDELSGTLFLIVDEWSMVGCRLLNVIHQRCMQMKSCDKPFGGLYVYLFGDIKQLPAIGDIPLYREEIGQNDHSAKNGSMLFRSIDYVKILKTCHRQQDVRFLKYLDNVSNGVVEEEDILYMSDRFESNVSDEERELFIDAVHLHMTRKEVNQYNEEKLRVMNVPVLAIEAENNSKIAAACSDDLACNLIQNLYLCIGARVMLRSNLWIDGALCNGSIGVVCDIIYSGDENNVPEFIKVKFDGFRGRTLPDGTIPIKKVLRSWYVADHYCTRIQFPLILAYSMTFHKAQSLTLLRVVLHIEKKENQAGLYYVGLSRVKNKADILISGSDFNSPLFELNESMYFERRDGLTWIFSKG